MKWQKKYLLLFIPLVLTASSCSTTKIVSCSELNKWDRPEQIHLKDNTEIYTYSNYSSFTVDGDTLCISRTKSSQPVKCISCDDIKSMDVLVNAKVKPPIIISSIAVAAFLILFPW